MAPPTSRSNFNFRDHRRDLEQSPYHDSSPSSRQSAEWNDPPDNILHIPKNDLGSPLVREDRVDGVAPENSESQLLGVPSESELNQLNDISRAVRTKAKAPGSGLDQRHRKGRLQRTAKRGLTARVRKPRLSAPLQYCLECSKSFSTGKKLEEHAKESRHRTFVCDQPDCMKDFLRRDTLATHGRIHKESHPFWCRLCTNTKRPVRYRRVDNLKRHLRDVHKDDMNVYAKAGESRSSIITTDDTEDDAEDDPKDDAEDDAEDVPQPNITTPAPANIAPTKDASARVTVEAVKPVIERLLGRTELVVDLMHDLKIETEASKTQDVAEGLAAITLADPQRLFAGILGPNHRLVKMIDPSSDELKAEEKETLANDMVKLALVQPKNKLRPKEEKNLHTYRPREEVMMSGPRWSLCHPAPLQRRFASSLLET